MWTAENRGRYDRSRLRYPSDLTDEEWALIAPRIPPAKRGGNKRTSLVCLIGLRALVVSGAELDEIAREGGRLRPPILEA